MQKGKDNLPVIQGHRLEKSLADHVRGCKVLIDREQTRCAPDNALIALLCDSVRLAREYDRWVMKRESEL